MAASELVGPDGQLNRSQLSGSCSTDVLQLQAVEVQPNGLSRLCRLRTHRPRLRANVQIVKAPLQKHDHVEPAVAEFLDELRRVSRALLSYLVKHAHLSNLGLIEYLVLARACDENGVTARDAARAFDLSTSTMTGISDRLEKDKLVRRHPHPTDRRVLVLKATRRGQAVLARSSARLVGDLTELAAALDPEQREALTRTLRQISDRIGRDLEPQPEVSASP